MQDWKSHPLRRDPIPDNPNGNPPTADSERRRMMAGELYYAFGKDLLDERVKAKQLCSRLNKMDDVASDHPDRMDIFKQLLGGMGEGCFIESPFRVDYGSNITLGRNVYMNFGCTILDGNKVEIGDNVLIAPNVSFFAATHPTDPLLRTEWGPELAKPIKIGNDVWIGGNVVICPGVTVGDGVTIGAGSVVTKNVESRVVVAGNPARVIKHL
ncbi:hypothetical protein HDU98_002205 [Podochytrium sp. JEL0797]|nr:hypothetical protein HDU98_002205 [Podochytrium sp. JEL0797]